jgi:hypothetical protein
MKSMLQPIHCVERDDDDDYDDDDVVTEHVTYKNADLMPVRKIQ